MNTKLVILNILTLLAIAVALLRGNGTGPLDPPGAPADGVYRTLEEVYTHSESRTPISSLPFTIGTSGSYYLTGNLTTNGNGISIEAESVTIDLNGFTIASTAGNIVGSAIGVPFGATEYQCITIENGHIRGSSTIDGEGGGFLYGIRNSGWDTVLVKNVTVHGCHSGIVLLAAPGAVVDHCRVSQASGVGIVADSVFNSTAQFCAASAIEGNLVSNCVADSRDATGINASIVTACKAAGETFGIHATIATASSGRATQTGLWSQIASDCYGTSAAADQFGIKVMGCATGCRARNLAEGTALESAIAVACTSLDGPIVAPEKHLGTP